MPVYKGVVIVTPKEGILDPQGKAIAAALGRLGQSAVQGVRAGKYFEVLLDAETLREAEAALNDIGRRVLSNPVIESFRITVTEVDGQ